MFNFFNDPIDSFLKSLTYWQNLNLRTRLLISKNPSISFDEAKTEALLQLTDDENNKQLKYSLEEAMNSPK